MKTVDKNFKVTTSKRKHHSTEKKCPPKILKENELK